MARNLVARLPRRARLARAEWLTETGTVRLTFDVIDGQPFRFVPGQFVSIDANIHRLGYRRSPYCLCSSPGEAPEFQLLVRTVPVGPMSLVLTGLNPGDVISFRGPTGHSMLPRWPGKELVLLATGVGLGPGLSLARHLAPTGEAITLYWGLRQEADICLIDELDRLRMVNPNFSYHISLSRPGPGWHGLRGRITATVPERLGDLNGKSFYLLCNGAMIAEMRAALEEMGVLGSDIYVESFFNHRFVADPDQVATICRLFAPQTSAPLFTSLPR